MLDLQEELEGYMHQALRACLLQRMHRGAVDVSISEVSWLFQIFRRE